MKKYIQARFFAHILIRVYQLTLSSLFGRTCRYLPSCSYYTDEAIQKYGLWAGGWMGFARICRCNPYGSHGIDSVPDQLPVSATWYQPWRYARWRGTHNPMSFSCEHYKDDQTRHL